MLYRFTGSSSRGGACSHFLSSFGAAFGIFGFSSSERVANLFQRSSFEYFATASQRETPSSHADNSGVVMMILRELRSSSLIEGSSFWADGRSGSPAQAIDVNIYFSNSRIDLTSQGWQPGECRSRPQVSCPRSYRRRE